MNYHDKVTSRTYCIADACFITYKLLVLSTDCVFLFCRKPMVSQETKSSNLRGFLRQTFYALAAQANELWGTRTRPVRNLIIIYLSMNNMCCLSASHKNNGPKKKIPQMTKSTKKLSHHLIIHRVELKMES